MCCGLVLEAAADMQKSAAKRKNPHRFVDTGLYRVVRCPNYLGEILFWTGVLLSGIPALTSPLRVLAALVGWICIVYIMFNGAQRLERRQNKRYGGKKEYQEYVKKTPIILPFLPIYHLNKKD
jgi:steroid 5-alpha reductase family enzyme